MLRFKPCLIHIPHFSLGMVPVSCSSLSHTWVLSWRLLVSVGQNYGREMCYQHRVMNNQQIGAVTGQLPVLVLTCSLILLFNLQYRCCQVVAQYSTISLATQQHFTLSVSRKALAIHARAIQEIAIWSHLYCLFARNTSISHYKASKSTHVPPPLSINMPGYELERLTNWHVSSCLLVLAFAGWALTPGRRARRNNSFIPRALLLGMTEPSVTAISFTVPCL